MHPQEEPRGILADEHAQYSEDYRQDVLVYSAVTRVLSWRVHRTRWMCALCERHHRVWISRVHPQEEPRGILADEHAKYSEDSKQGVVVYSAVPGVLSWRVNITMLMCTGKTRFHRK